MNGKGVLGREECTWGRKRLDSLDKGQLGARDETWEVGGKQTAWDLVGHVSLDP